MSVFALRRRESRPAACSCTGLQAGRRRRHGAHHRRYGRLLAVARAARGVPRSLTDIVRPVVEELVTRGAFSGLLYAGLMLTTNGPRCWSSTAASATPRRSRSCRVWRATSSARSRRLRAATLEGVELDRLRRRRGDRRARRRRLPGALATAARRSRGSRTPRRRARSSSTPAPRCAATGWSRTEDGFSPSPAPVRRSPRPAIAPTPVASRSASTVPDTGPTSRSRLPARAADEDRSAGPGANCSSDSALLPPGHGGDLVGRGELARWLEVELAALEGWAETGVVPREAIDAFVNGPRSDARARRRDRGAGAARRHRVRRRSRRRARRGGPWFHYGLTSSDVLDTALALQMRDAGALILAGIDRASPPRCARAEEHRGPPTIGRTHGVHAEPTTFGLKLAGWAFELERDRERVARALEGIASASSPAQSAPTPPPIPRSSGSRASGSGSSPRRAPRRSSSATAMRRC